MSYPRTPVSTDVTLRCPYCSAEQEVEVTAVIQRDVRPEGTGWIMEDVDAAPLPATCWACAAPHIDRDLAPALAARLDALTVEAFR